MYLYWGDWMKNSVRNQMIFNLFLILLFIFGAITSVFYISFSRNQETDEYVAGEAAASFALVEINGEKAKTYVKTKETDDDYSRVVYTLIDYVRNSNVDRIRLVSYTESVAYSIYDTAGTELAKKIIYDDYTTEMKKMLIDCRESWNVTRGGVNYTFCPLRTKDDVAVGYIITETSAEENSVHHYMVFIIAGMVVFLALISFLLVMLLDRLYFDQIKKFTEAAELIINSDSENSYIDDDRKAAFRTGRNDQIGRLGNAIDRMITVFNNSKTDIKNAIHDATHDGMTDAYNKRHYENRVTSFRNCSSLLVIYFDVNNLKLINDTLGHERGDYVIKRAAEYISSIAEILPESMNFRMGGDEFLLVATNCTYRQMTAAVNRLDDECPMILSADSDSIKCSVAYGYAYEKGSYVYEDLLSEAEESMYRKKYEIKQQLNMPDR